MSLLTVVICRSTSATLQDCFVLGSKIFGRSVDNDDMKEFAWNVFQTAINSGVAVGEAGLVLCMAPATIGGITVLAVSALATYSAVGLS